MQVQLFPSALAGTAAVPPSKSIAHRAVLCAALATGESQVRGLQPSQDVQATLAAVQQLGCRTSPLPGGLLVQPAKGFATVLRPVDCAESGSTLRFVAPLFSLTGQRVRLVGRGRLMQRPQQVYAQLFAAHGSSFVQQPDGITVFGALQPGQYALPGSVSSQFVSGLLFALPLLPSPSTIVIAPPVESRSYIQLTRSVQAAFGVHSRWQTDTTLYVPGGQQYAPAAFSVEGDYSQAAFLAVLAAAAAPLALTGLAQSTAQGDAVILDHLRAAGAQVSWQGDVLHVAPGALHGIQADLADCPDLGPILMVLGALAQGETVLHNAARLRIKESDRIAAMETELRRFGVVISSTPDTVRVVGGLPLHAPAQPLASHNDHRVAMSLAVLALAAGLPACITGAEAVAKSWPGFWADIRALGAEVNENVG